MTRPLSAALALLALGRVASVSAQAAPAVEALTVEDAVALALRDNRGVAVAAMQVKRAEELVGASRTRRLPNLELEAMAGTTLNAIRITFPAGSFGTFPATGPIPSTDAVVEAPRAVSGSVNATLAQPLTQLYRIGLGTRLNELSRDIEQQRLREQRAAVAAEVRRLYYQLLQAETALRAKEEQVAVYRELDRVVGQQVAVEAALKSDGLEVKARLAGAEYELEELKGNVATGRERMNLYLGRELDHAFSLVAVPDTSLEEVDLGAAMSRAVQRRPDLAQARLAVEQADTDRRLKKAELIPDVSLALKYYSFVNVDLLPRNIAQVGLQLKWEPFDWGRRGKERAEKAIQVEQARSRERDAAERARLEVAQYFRKLHEARLLIEAERLRGEAARERLRVLTSRQAQEAALLKDVLEAQATTSAANASYEQALLVFWTAKADFQKAIGEEQ